MALRGLSQAVAKEYACRGIHACHLRMDCTFDSPRNRAMFAGMGMSEAFDGMAGQNKLAGIAALADTYWAVARQSPMAWSNEIDLRPYTEDWTF